MREELVRTVTGAVEMPGHYVRWMEVQERNKRSRRTFVPLAISDVVRGLFTVFICCIVDVIPKLKLIARIQGPKLSRCIGFQPIRGHSGIAVGVVVEGK